MIHSEYDGGYDEMTDDGRIRHKSITPMHQNAGTGTWVRRGSSWEDAHSEENTKREDLVSKPGRHFEREISRVNYERKQSEKEKAEAAGASAPPEPTTASDLAHALADLSAEAAAAPPAAAEDVLWA